MTIAPVARLFKRSIQITFADGTKVKRETRFAGVKAGQSLPTIPADFAQAWAAQMAIYEVPVTDVRFIYRKA
jgi:hypothetical protein